MAFQRPPVIPAILHPSTPEILSGSQSGSGSPILHPRGPLRNPGGSPKKPTLLSFLRKQESGRVPTPCPSWIPAFAGMTAGCRSLSNSACFQGKRFGFLAPLGMTASRGFLNGVVR